MSASIPGSPTPATSSESSVPAIPPSALSPTLWISSLAVFAVFLDTSVLFVAFPSITDSFPTVAPQQLSWVLNGYTIVFAALLVPFGRLADRRGHRAVFIAGLIVFTLSSLLCAVAPEPITLIVARALQAVGGAALVPSSLALVLRATPFQRLPVGLAIWGATGAVAGALGPTIGAALVQWGGWRWVFIINLPVGVITVLLARRFVAESREPATRIPAVAGVILLIIGTGLISLGLVRSEEWGWSSSGVIATFAGGGTALGLFIWHQRVTSAPTIDLALFGIRNYAWINLVSIAFGIGFSAMFLSSILFLTEVWEFSILQAGLAVAPGPLSVVVLAPLMGRLAERIGQQPLLIAGGVVFAAAGVLRLVLLDESVAYVRDWLPSTVLTGIGVALCLPQISSVVGQALPPDQFGVGGGANQAIRQFAGTAGVAITIGIVTTASQRAGTTGQPNALLDVFDRLWWLLVITGIVSSICALPLRTKAVVAGT